MEAPDRTPRIRIPGYVIENEIGRGGVATVYLATQQSLDRKVALKVMSPALAAEPDFTERFEREGRTVARFSHPKIVTIFDVGVADYQHYIAMEYLNGGSLKRHLTRPADAAWALSIVDQMAQALGYAHSQGYVHRDVKPENILFRNDGAAVLTDFGIAKSSDSHTQLTRSGTIVGTPRYMSPEQAQGENATERSDIYALGVILYEMLTARPPFDTPESLSVLLSHMNDPIPELPASSARLQPLVDAMMAKDPEDRVPDCGTLADIVKMLEQELKSPTTSRRKLRTPVRSVEQLRRDRASAVKARQDVDADAVTEEIPIASLRSRASTETRQTPVRRGGSAIARLLWLGVSGAVVGSAAWYVVNAGLAGPWLERLTSPEPETAEVRPGSAAAESVAGVETPVVGGNTAPELTAGAGTGTPATAEGVEPGLIVDSQIVGSNTEIPGVAIAPAADEPAQSSDPVVLTDPVSGSQDTESVADNIVMDEPVRQPDTPLDAGQPETAAVTGDVNQEEAGVLVEDSSARVPAVQPLETDAESPQPAQGGDAVVITDDTTISVASSDAIVDNVDTEAQPAQPLAQTQSTVVTDNVQPAIVETLPQSVEEGLAASDESSDGISILTSEPDPASVTVPGVTASDVTASVDPGVSDTILAGDTVAAQAPVDQVQIDTLLQTANDYVGRDRLSHPPGENAVEIYQQVLSLQPANGAARDGLMSIATIYFERATDKYNAGDNAGAALEIERGLKASSDYAGLLSLGQKIRETVEATAAFKEAEDYFYGAGVDVDFNRAFERYSEAAAKGHTEAKRALASLYANGLGVTRNEALAVEWLRTAASDGDAEAQYSLGLGLLFGQNRNPAEAGEWINRAVDAEYERAYRVLGWMHQTGTGVSQSPTEAIKWGFKGVLGEIRSGENADRKAIMIWEEQFESAYDEAVAPSSSASDDEADTQK